jgi:hypothetical protein
MRNMKNQPRMVNGHLLEVQKLHVKDQGGVGGNHAGDPRGAVSKLNVTLHNLNFSLLLFY